jgi:hypothetical protein
VLAFITIMPRITIAPTSRIRPTTMTIIVTVFDRPLDEDELSLDEELLSNELEEPGADEELGADVSGALPPPAGAPPPPKAGFTGSGGASDVPSAGANVMLGAAGGAPGVVGGTPGKVGGVPAPGPKVVPVKVTPQTGQRVWPVPVVLVVVPRNAPHLPQVTL